MAEPKTAELLERIDNNKERISAQRPFSADMQRQLLEYYRILSTYCSNALEGNSLTLKETKVVIEDGLAIGGKTLRDHNEALGGSRAYDAMLTFSREAELRVSEDMILELHHCFYVAIDPRNAGKYRSIKVFITGTDYVPPPPDAVPRQMTAFVKKLDIMSGMLHPMEVAAYAHRRLAEIHPFVDGNGRTARLLMNLILLNKGYSIISIPLIRSIDYLRALQAAQNRDNPDDEPFRRLIFECEIEEQERIAQMLGVKLKNDID